MFSPIFITIIVIIIDKLFKVIINSEKQNKPIKKDKTTFRDLVASFEESFELKPRNFKVNEVFEIENTNAQKQRDERILSQQKKVSEHSDYDRNVRLKKRERLKKTNLADSRLQMQKYDDYDLDKVKELAIKTEVNQVQDLRSSKYLDLNRDLIKGIILSEVLDKPKSLK